mmetsp:Transcript_2302/g.3151  ORF Transcript_2302/g.3151 Transcript_2302/m.3151 type:complete len:217 (+) Transcript_2302:2793-3443(+)
MRANLSRLRAAPNKPPSLRSPRLSNSASMSAMRRKAFRNSSTLKCLPSTSLTVTPPPAQKASRMASGSPSFCFTPSICIASQKDEKSIPSSNSMSLVLGFVPNNLVLLSFFASKTPLLFFFIFFCESESSDSESEFFGTSFFSAAIVLASFRSFCSRWKRTSTGVVLKESNTSSSTRSIPERLKFSASYAIRIFSKSMIPTRPERFVSMASNRRLA